MTDTHRGLGGMCYSLKPGDIVRCLKTHRHDDDHYSWRHRISWPNKDVRTPATTASL